MRPLTCEFIAWPLIDGVLGSARPPLPTKPSLKDGTRKGDAKKASAMGVESPEGVSWM